VWKRLHAVVLTKLHRRGEIDLARAVVDSASVRALRGGNKLDRTPRGRPGRPARRPHLVQGDRGDDSQPHRDRLRDRGIRTQLAKRRTPHGSGLGRTRRVVERTRAWLHRCRRLNVRDERRPCIHEAFLSLGCALICW
jgi:transposase